MGVDIRVYGNGSKLESGARILAIAVGGGLVGGVGMGVILQFVVGLMPVVGDLVGRPSAEAGWYVQLAVSVAFALAFAWLAFETRLRRYGREPVGLVVAGAVYGVALEFVFGAVAFPLLADATGAADLPVPLVTTRVVVAYLVYGFLLGGTFALALGIEAGTAETERPAAGP